MNSEQWQQVKELFEAALEFGPNERTAFLKQVCQRDEEVRSEVESLLAAHERDAVFMSKPIGNLLPDVEPVLAESQSFGPYEELSPLGEGGMGQVYVAVDTRLGRKVALKLLPPRFTNDPDRVGRFEQEARATSALNHPNIVTIHEIGEFDSVHFIATEFIDGATLREHLATGEMSLGQVLDIAAQVSSALAAAHEAGVVHRDIKPENLMLRRDGFVKVLDFGLAKLAFRSITKLEHPGNSKIQLKTDPGVVMGTVHYMSPEQARGEDMDSRTDIWSLGVVLYEMLTGRVPFTGETPSHVIVSILETELSPPSRYVELPAQLEQIVLKTLSKKREERYQKASQIAVELSALRQELEVEARLKRITKLNDSAKQFTPGNDALTRKTSTIEFLVSNFKTRKTHAALFILILLVGAVGFAYVAMNRRKGNLAAASSRKSIAVLPLIPIDTANRDELYEIGIADSLIHRLSSMHGFVIRPLNATRRYRDVSQDPIAAGREQQVDYVLQSNYQFAGGKIRITAQLINVGTAQLEKTYRVEKDFSNILATQDAIAVEIGNGLLTQFATTTGPQTAKRGTTNEEAYRLYLQGMYLANNRNLADAQKAIAALEKAVSLDPNYARAWAGLGYAHRTLSLWTNTLTTQETYQKSIEAINKALALDQNLSEAHSALCENKYLYEWDFAAAENECRRAIELDLYSAQAHEIFSRYLMGRGRLDEATVEIKLAIDLEPTSRFNQRNYGRALLYARRYPEAANQFKRVLEMDQNFVSTYSWLTSTLALQGNEAEAFEWFMKLLSVRKVDEGTAKMFVIAFRTSGWQGVLREWLARFDKVGGNNFDAAVFNAQIGNKDKALALLEKGYERKEIWMTYLRVDPRLDALRDEPRFEQLLRRVEAR